MMEVLNKNFDLKSGDGFAKQIYRTTSIYNIHLKLYFIMTNHMKQRMRIGFCKGYYFSTYEKYV